MSDTNPYQPPHVPDVPNTAPLPDTWPQTASAVIDAEIFARAFRVDSRTRQRRMRWISAFVFFLVISGIFIYNHPEQAAIGIFLGSVAAVLFWLSLRFTRLQTRQFHKQLQELGKEHEEVHYEFDPDYIRFTTDESYSRLPWERFLKWKEHDGMLLLYRSSRLYILLPIEQLEPNVQEALRACVRARVRPA